MDETTRHMIRDACEIDDRARSDFEQSEERAQRCHPQRRSGLVFKTYEPAAAVTEPAAVPTAMLDQNFTPGQATAIREVLLQFADIIGAETGQLENRVAGRLDRLENKMLHLENENLRRKICLIQVARKTP